MLTNLQAWTALRRVTRVAARFRLERYVHPRYQNKLKLLLWLAHPFTARVRKSKLSPHLLKLALEEMGPLFIKFGQILSTRRDVLPDDLAQTLTQLQDQVKPFDGQLAQDLVQRSLPLAFSSFEIQPLASASIAQVHAATTLDGKSVIVKILRPQIHEQAESNLQALYLIAHLIKILFPQSKRFNPIALIEELDYTIRDELDLLKEAANASQLKRNFQNSPLLYVPEVYWEYCRESFLVTERIHGAPLGNIAQLQAQKVNLKRLAERGVTIFYTQVFSHAFFHADMHPGNLFVDIQNPEDPKYMAIDFGIMGSLNREDQYYLACNFLAFFRRDYRQVAELHIRSGWVSPSTRIERLESAIRTVCEPIFEKPLKDISFGQTLLRLFQIAQQFDMTIQPQLLLLQKTLINVEGLGRDLYPELDLWATAKPFLERWMKDHIGLKSIFKRLKAQAPFISEHLPQVPQMLITKLARESRLEPPALLQAPSISPWAQLLRGLGLGLLGVLALNQLGIFNLAIQTWINQYSASLGMIGLSCWLIQRFFVR